MDSSPLLSSPGEERVIPFSLISLNISMLEILLQISLFRVFPTSPTASYVLISIPFESFINSSSSENLVPIRSNQNIFNAPTNQSYWYAKASPHKDNSKFIDPSPEQKLLALRYMVLVRNALFLYAQLCDSAVILRDH